MSAPNMERFCRLAVNGLIVNPNIYDGGAVETVGVRSSPQPTNLNITEPFAKVEKDVIPACFKPESSF